MHDSAIGAWQFVCESAELAVETSRLAEMVGCSAEPVLSDTPVREARRLVEEGLATAVLVSTPPDIGELVQLAIASREARRQVVVGIIGIEAEHADALAAAADVALVAVTEVRPAIAAVALLAAGAVEPWRASLRGLAAVDRGRLRHATSAPTRAGGRLVREVAGVLGWCADGSERAALIGEPRDVSDALIALEAASEGFFELAPVRGDRASALDVLYGPPRALSDPASKAALKPYGIALPDEELCASPSRASSEAARIGFPVRIALASPDLRIWDHPDLAADGVDNAARVRDVFRQITGLAEARAPEARVLGVTVTATTAARALLRVELRAIDSAHVLARIGFADTHGDVSGDETVMVLPAPASRVERSLRRLAGADLILGEPASVRRETVASLTEALSRLASFTVDFAREVERTELHPLALLLDGRVEAREARVTVSDAFVRALESPAVIRPG